MTQTSQSLWSRWTPAEIILALTFLVAPFFYYDNIGGAGLNIPSNIAVWLSACIFTWLAVRQVLNNSTLTLPKHTLVMLAFPLLATISGFISGVSEPIDWMFRLLFIWGGTFFLLGLFQFQFSRARKDLFLYFLLIAGLLHAFVACLQFFQPDGVKIFLPKSGGTNIATGIFQQINIHASFQATVVLIAWYLINRPLAKFNLVIKASILLTTFLSSYIVMSSGSRVGFLSLFVGLALYLPICWSVLKRNKNNVFVITAVMIMASLTGIYSDGFGRLANKSAEIHTEYKTSERIGIYLISAELVENKPIFGHGLGSFESVWQYQKADFQQKHPDYTLIQDYITHPHNELLLWQVEGGLLASSGILITFFTILVMAWQSRARYAIPILFPFAFHNQVELPFHISATAWFACLLLIFIALSHTKKIQIKDFMSVPMRNVLRLQNHFLLLMATVFFIHAALANYQLDIATKNGEKAKLSMPAMNPYFTKIAEDFRMQQVFTMASMERNEAAMKIFNHWQQQAILDRPTAFNFKMLIASYQNIQNQDKACSTAIEASLMYRENKEFNYYVEACRR